MSSGAGTNHLPAVVPVEVDILAQQFRNLHSSLTQFPIEIACILVPIYRSSPAAQNKSFIPHATDILIAQYTGSTVTRPKERPKELVHILVL